MQKNKKPSAQIISAEDGINRGTTSVYLMLTHKTLIGY